MKTISQFITEAKKAQIDPQDDCMNFIDAADLKKYLTICDKFISKESKELIQWFIVNNSSYMKDLKVEKPTTDSIVASFYNAGPYKDQYKKELYALIGKINKSGRLLEIPQFQTKEQFDAILSKKCSPDAIIIDLDSERGRSEIAKKYQPLCYKIANSFKGKSNLSFDDILSAAFEGLTWAMNSYGKKSNKAQQKEEVSGEQLDTSTYKTTTFLTYASYMIRFAILEAIKGESHLVRIPTSEQSRERKEKGSNTKNRSLSGDKSINGEEGGKSLFDLVGGSENSTKSLEQEDIINTWKDIIKLLKASGKFNEKMIKCWMEFNQIGGTEKRKNKEIASELGITPSNVTYYCTCINNFIKNDKKIRALAQELRSLYAEAKQRSYEDENDEPIYVKYSTEKEDEI